MNNKYIEKREGKNGVTYRVSYDGKTKSFSESKLGTDALKLARRYRDQLMSDAYMYDNFKTINDVFEDVPIFFNLRHETKRKYNLYYNKYMSSYKDKIVLKLKKSDIMDCLNAMVEIASDDVITRVMAIWRKISLYCVYHDIIQHDICYGIIPPKSQLISKPKEINYVDKDVIKQMDNICHLHLKSNLQKEQIPCMLWVLYYTGMRLAECLALSVTDIDYDNNVIHITKEIGSSMDNDHTIRQCKTPTSIRDIPIVDALIPYLDKAIELSYNGILFPTDSGFYYRSNYLGSLLNKLSKRYGIKFNLYAIRHYFSTSLVDKTDIRTLQELMGHANPNQTIQYARSNDAKKKDALSKR